jgi:hypothetical protein
MRILRLAALALVLMSVVGRAEIPSEVQKAIEAYRGALLAAQQRSNDGAIERAFAALTSVHDALLQTTGGETALEALSPAEFDSLTAAMTGAVIGRDEVLVVDVDTDYFLKLAASRGTRVDRTFFASRKATYPESTWPIYVEQQTDYSGCTKFGTGTLVSEYRRWTRFAVGFPRRYTAAVRREVERVSNELTQSTCACGTRSSVEQEFRQFLRVFPRAPISAMVGARLRDVRTGRTDIRAQCHSG